MESLSLKLKLAREKRAANLEATVVVPVAEVAPEPIVYVEHVRPIEPEARPVLSEEAHGKSGLLSRIGGFARAFTNALGVLTLVAGVAAAAGSVGLFYGGLMVPPMQVVEVDYPSTLPHCAAENYNRIEGTCAK